MPLNDDGGGDGGGTDDEGLRLARQRVRGGRETWREKDHKIDTKGKTLNR
jgi:hypothetical protein